VQRKHAAAKAGGAGVSRPDAVAVKREAAIKNEVVETVDSDEEQEDAGQTAAAAAAEQQWHWQQQALAIAEAAAAAEAQAAAAAAVAVDGDDEYDEAVLRGNGPGAINLTSKSRATYGNSSNQQDTRLMLMRRLRALLAAAGQAQGGPTLGAVYEEINTRRGLSQRGSKWNKPREYNGKTAGLMFAGCAGCM
jgi:hypothetical protein